MKKTMVLTLRTPPEKIDTLEVVTGSGVVLKFDTRKAAIAYVMNWMGASSDEVVIHYA